MELLVIVRTGRFQILDSGGIKVKNVEVNEDVFTFEITQFKLAPFAALKLKVRCLIADVKGEGREELAPITRARAKTKPSIGFPFDFMVFSFRRKMRVKI